MIDIGHEARREQALRVAAMTPSILAALHRVRDGRDPVEPDPTLGHAASYLYETTGTRPSDEHARAVEQYMILTVDHGFNASTFTARVVASTGADVADAVCAAIGALAGPLHGGAPSRALDALDAIGNPDRAPEWVRQQRSPPAGASWGSDTPCTEAPRPPVGTVPRGGRASSAAISSTRRSPPRRRSSSTLAELKPDRPVAEATSSSTPAS